MFHIVVLSNDIHSCKLLTKTFNKAEHHVTIISDAENALIYLQQQVVDLLLLDNQPLSVETELLVSEIYERFATPILLLTMLADEEKLVALLKAGVDHYIQKPCSSRLLLMHIEVLLRRVSLEKKRLAMQNCSQQLSLKLERLALTETERLLLQYLSKKSGDIVSKATLQREVLKKELSAFDRNLDVHISNIRRKMLKAGLSKQHIKTVHGQGYIFSEKVA